MIVERLTIAPTMSTSRIDMDRGRHVVLIELLIIVKTIGSRYGLIIIAQGKESTRCSAVHL